MITTEHIQMMAELLRSGEVKTKKEAFELVVDYEPAILDSYASFHSAQIRAGQILAETYPDEFKVTRRSRDANQLPMIMGELRKPIHIDKIDADPDAEIVEENIRYQQQLQRQRDMNRIERKAFRNKARVENSLKEYYDACKTAFADAMEDRLFDFEVRTGRLDEDAAAMVVHLSDLHFNELIDMPENKYDFEVASKRLMKLAAFARLQGLAFGVQKIVIACGGDFMNSDRRRDEILSMATNRARATVLSVLLLEQFVRDLRQDFFIDLIGITGNEGRAHQELCWGDTGVTDSYDGQIYDFLGQALTSVEDPGMRVFPLRGNEYLFKLHKELFLLLHGHQVNATDQKKVQSIIGRYSMANGCKVTQILCGHIHATNISDFVSRNSSLAGSNAYSGDGLQLASKAAQNIHIVTPDSLYGMKVDLQDTGDIEGYAISHKLAEYNAKSHDKQHRMEHPPEPIVVMV